METQKNKRLVLTSVNQVIALVQSNPQLVGQIPRFERLRTMTPSTTPKKSCNCGAKKNITTPDVNKQAAESVLSSLDNSDFIKIKNVLGLNELCYYSRNSENKLEMTCI